MYIYRYVNIYIYRYVYFFYVCTFVIICVCLSKKWSIDPQYAGVCNAWFWGLAGLRFCRGITIL